MKSYHDIFPGAHLPVLTLEVEEKTVRLPRGSYRYLEYFCTEPGCDCRRVSVVVVNEKLRHMAVIGFGFDGEGPLAGPYLDTSSYQAPYADALLEFFAETLNSRPQWLTRMYRQYREVRELFDRKSYGGKAFPPPGRFFYKAKPAPDLAALLEQSLRQSEQFCKRSAPAAAGRKKAKATKGGQPPATRAEAQGMARLVELYAKAGSCAPLGMLLALQSELRRHLLATPRAGEELALLLPALSRQAGDDDGAFDAALRLLYDTLDYYQVALEGDAPGAKQQMQRFQSALLAHVFNENPDPDLCLAVAGICSNSRVRLIPGLELAIGRHDASLPGAEDPSGGDLLTVMARMLREKGIVSPYDGARELREFFDNNDPELRVPLAGALLAGDDPFLREVSALLLFGHDPSFSLEVSQILAGVEGSRIAPETLRRLIISRNWFPEGIRKNIDLAIGNARRARVDCASMSVPHAYSVHVSSQEGAGALGVKVAVSQRSACTVCSLLVTPQEGITDCRVTELGSPRELDLMLAGRKAGWKESTPERLDEIVCQALADSLASGRVPCSALLRTAELLGRDCWRGQCRGDKPGDEGGSVDVFHPER